MRDNYGKTPTMLTLLVKAAAVLVIGSFLITLVLFTVYTVSGVDENISQAELVSWCEDDYYSRDFQDLYETLTLYALYSEDYAVYWEVVEGYQACIQYIQWERAAQLGIENAEKEAEMHFTRLQELAEQPAFARNELFLKEFLTSAQNAVQSV